MNEKYGMHLGEPPRDAPLPRSSAGSDPLEDLVARFSKALLAKLKLAQANGRSGWEHDDWERQCQEGLLRHVAKGDPRDVAAYCAFMWHHGWITAAPRHLGAVSEQLTAFSRSATEPQSIAWRPMEEASKQSRVLYINRYGEVGHCSWYEAKNEGEEACWWDDERDDEVVPLGWMPQLPAWSSPVSRPHHSPDKRPIK